MLELRLHGRVLERGERLISYASSAIPGAGSDPGDPIRLRLAGDLDHALTGSDVILCQVRPGGMRARAEDERLAVEAGVPGDEGLGPSGLAGFLRARPVMDRIVEAWTQLAPEAAFLQLSSPLSLNVAHGCRRAGRAMLGLCELPATVWAAVRAEVEPRLGSGPLRRAHYGSNHWSWLYDFRDEGGLDRTGEVIAALDTRMLVEVEAEICRREHALPLPYLRLLYHPQRELHLQQARAHTRGEELEAWSAALDAAYRARSGPDAPTIAGLLARRRMNWYEEAVVPMLHAVLAAAERELVLNVTGVEADIAVELPCIVQGTKVTPVPQPLLPGGPAALFHKIARYEHAALSLPDLPRAEEIAEVLWLHPLVADAAHASRIADQICRSLRQPEAVGSCLTGG
jgi:6-phospho-beta-glucosidase